LFYYIKHIIKINSKRTFESFQDLKESLPKFENDQTTKRTRTVDEIYEEPDVEIFVYLKKLYILSNNNFYNINYYDIFDILKSIYKEVYMHTSLRLRNMIGDVSYIIFKNYEREIESLDIHSYIKDKKDEDEDELYNDIKNNYDNMDFNDIKEISLLSFKNSDIPYDEVVNCLKKEINGDLLNLTNIIFRFIN